MTAPDPPIVLGAWRVVHIDDSRMVATLERTRRFFKGRYRVVTRKQLLNGELERRGF